MDAPHLFDREGGPYSAEGRDFGDNAQRFAALSWVGAQMARQGCDGWKADILHAHDWQAGLAPAYLAYGGTGGVGTVMTVHNIAFQGWAPAAQLGDLRLPMSEYHPGALEYYRRIVEPEGRAYDGGQDHHRFAHLCRRTYATRVWHGFARGYRGTFARWSAEY